MISAKELLKITNDNNTQDKIDGWWELSKPKLEIILLERAKLGKNYLLLNQSSLKWMSVPEFREKVKMELDNNGYITEEQSHNGIRIIW